MLIVDDTPANLALLSEVLHDDYRTLVATSGERALQLANAPDAPDLILLDVVMPHLSGYEVCARLKQNPATRDIPVIFVSAQHEVEDETRGLGLGGVDFLAKPISPPIVKARVRTHLTLHQQRRGCNVRSTSSNRRPPNSSRGTGCSSSGWPNKWRR